MNIYSLIAFLILIIVVGHFFHLGPAIEGLANSLADIPRFEEKGNSPHLYDLAIRLAYLIVFVAVVKIIFSGRKGNE